MAGGPFADAGTEDRVMARRLAPRPQPLAREGVGKRRVAEAAGQVDKHALNGIDHQGEPSEVGAYECVYYVKYYDCTCGHWYRVGPYYGPNQARGVANYLSAKGRSAYVETHDC